MSQREMHHSSSVRHMYTRTTLGEYPHPSYVASRYIGPIVTSGESIRVGGNRSVVSIPFAFPPLTRRLDLSGGWLTYLHNNLPSALEELEVSNNRLIELPNSLPRPLHTLNASFNRLCTLPDEMPPNLRRLYLSHNHFVDLSPEEIDCLTRMAPSASVDLSFNPLSVQTIERLEQLQSSPGYRGPQIIFETTGLDLSWHELDSVPNDLPGNLQVLNLAFNPLTAPINNLPEDLLTLDLFFTGQRRLPDELPPRLRWLNFAHNDLVHISQANINTLLRMGTSALVNLEDNPLSVESYNRLDQLQNNPRYRGPRFILGFRPSPPVSRAVSVFQPTAGARVGEQHERSSVAIQNVAPTVLSRLDPEVATELFAIQRSATAAGHPIADAEFINMALDQIQLSPAQAEQPPARPAEPLSSEPRARRWTEAFPPEPRPAASPVYRSWNPFGTASWQLTIQEWAMRQPSAVGDRSGLYEYIVLAHLNRDQPNRLLRTRPRAGSHCPTARRGWLELNLGNWSIRSSPPAFPPRLFSLVLTHNRLTCPPSNLPRHLEWLEMGHNHFREWPNTLPGTLRGLYANNNRLCALPNRLPGTLQLLDLRYNHFVDLAPRDINCLTRMSPSARVHLSFNPLSAQTIERLEQLQSSPGYRGPQIFVSPTALDLSRCNLDSVPSDLPENLQELNLAHNPLSGSINNLPGTLRVLNLSHTGQRRLPDALPTTLRDLDFSGNELVHISQADINVLTRMDASARVTLHRNLLSANAFDRLEQLQSDPSYRGAGITYDHSAPAPGRPSGPVAVPISVAFETLVSEVLSRLDSEVAAELLEIQRTATEAGHPIGDAEFINMALDRMLLNTTPTDRRPAAPAATEETPAVRQRDPLTGLAVAVARWRHEPSNDIPPNLRRWQEFSAEPNATAFAHFLIRLASTTNANNPQFRNSVIEWLHHLETNPQLRSDTFVVSEGATATCGDRIYHAFNDMRQLRLASDVSNGDYDQRLPELLTLARGMFRLGQLEDIARKHAASRPGVDEIEVYLGFQVMLRERLALPLDIASMIYPSMAEIGPEHLERAYNRVIVAERRGFADYLANDWRPWQAVLQRLTPIQYGRAQERLIDAMDEEFSNRLQARLQEVGLENDPDAQRTIGPLVQAEIAREIKGPLTQDFLRSRGLLRHIR